MSEVIIGGLLELKKAFEELPKEFHRVALRKGVAAAAGVVLELAKAIAPKDTGNLSKSVYRKYIRSGSGPYQQTFIVGVRRGKTAKKMSKRIISGVGNGGLLSGRRSSGKLDAYYWTWVEFGTSKMPAQPFLRPAFEITKPQQINVMKESLKVGLIKATEKARSKYR